MLGMTFTHLMRCSSTFWTILMCQAVEVSVVCRSERPCSPTPRCNRRPWRCVQDRADFSESLCHLSCFSSPGARLMANRWAACGVGSNLMWVRFAHLRVRPARRAVILGEPSRCVFYTPTHIFLNRAFPYRLALIRGGQSGAAQHCVATDSPVAAILAFGGSYKPRHGLSYSSSPGLRLNANR